jgi:hypothetical protein
VSDYPYGMTVRPIDNWPGQLTPSVARQRSNFSAPWRRTLLLLQRELDFLRARRIVLQVAIRERDFRIDGYPRANATAEHPGVILAFESKHGPLRYATDLFTTWQDNLRAIALGLKALRRVDRYGISRSGEQYRGWKALPTAEGTIEQALATLLEHSDLQQQGQLANFGPRTMYAAALKRVHPDIPETGDRAAYDAVQAARKTLEEAGRW